MNLQVLALLSASVCIPARAELHLAGDFESQARRVLAELRPAHDAALAALRRDLRHTLHHAWPGVRIQVIGSLANRLALQNSDVDLVVTVNEDDEAAAGRLVKRALKLFQRDPDTYSRVLAGGTAGARHMPLIHLRHRATGRDCDISFSSQTSVESSRLLAYYLKLDQRITPLIFLIKLWIRTQTAGNRVPFRSNILYALVIFYLEQKHIVPPLIDLQVDTSDRYANKWDTNFNKIPFKSNNTESLYQLLGGFFNYYSTLNFADNVIAVRVGKVYPRSIFRNIGTIPEVFAVYKDYLKRPDSVPLALDYDICIQDMFGQNNNMTGLLV